MQFKWTINKLTVAQGNLVAKVDLIVTGTDGDNSASASYVRDLVCGDSVIAYDKLTEQQVLDWCFEPETIKIYEGTTITRLIKNEGEAQVAGQIARQLAQKAAEPALPWAQTTA